MSRFAVFAVESARRGALEAVARSQGTLVDSVGDVAALRRLLERGGVDIVLADGLAAEAVATLAASARFVAFAEEDEAIGLVLANAVAVLPRDADTATIAAALILVEAGLRLLPDVAFDRLRALAGVETAAPGEDEAPLLTRREHEVLAAMADGASNKVIARRLGISFHTAKFHVAAILAKLDADTRTEALARAARMGLVML